jgi:hypothetical protein
VKPHKSYKGYAMDKERNEIGKDVIERRKTTKASPRCLLKFLKKHDPEVKEDEPTIQEIEDPLPVGVLDRQPTKGSTRSR